MTTGARTQSAEGSHWYAVDGTPVYEVPYSDPRKGMRPTTLADARKMGLLPSVTTILRVLYRAGLEDWKDEQLVLAVLTTPRLVDEDLDGFIHRVLHVERIQDQEAGKAADTGTLYHGGLEAAFKDHGIAPELEPWIGPAYQELAKRGQVIATETIVVGDGYAGKVDLIQQNHEVWIWDFKTTKRLPKGEAWPEHKLQLAAYAKAWAKGDQPIRTGNVYISTVEQGQFCICPHDDWEDTYENGFRPLVQVWQHMNGYKPVAQ